MPLLTHGHEPGQSPLSACGYLHPYNVVQASRLHVYRAFVGRNVKQASRLHATAVSATHPILTNAQIQAWQSFSERNLKKLHPQREYLSGNFDRKREENAPLLPNLKKQTKTS